MGTVRILTPIPDARRRRKRWERSAQEYHLGPSTVGETSPEKPWIRAGRDGASRAGSQGTGDPGTAEPLAFLTEAGAARGGYTSSRVDWCLERKKERKGTHPYLSVRFSRAPY